MLLLVDGSEAHARTVSTQLGRAGWRIATAVDGESAIATLGTHDGLLVDAVLIDDRSVGGSIDAIITGIRKWRPQLPVLFLGDPLNRRASLAALAAGATDFIERPLVGERLLNALDNALSPRWSHELRPLAEKFPMPLAVEEIIGSAPAFRTALAIAAKAARARVPLLIEGEAGTGKALLAGAIHHAGQRPRTPLIEIDCGHHGEAMLGPMLFGHERGAFPGAFERRQGAIVEAHGGTIILDRVERLPLEIQADLAEVIATGRVRPIGSAVAHEVDVRFIACASVPLKRRMADRLFREDLLARLSVVEVSLPTLSDRRSDIPALVRHLVERISALPGMSSLSLAPDAMEAITAWHWPGNVRQLYDALIRAAAVCGGGQLGAADFPGLMAELASSPIARIQPQRAPEGIGITLYRADGNLRTLQDIEADVIRLAIGHYRGRMSEVARRLGIGRSTLYRKLAELGIDTAA